jgi:23S rRNA (adenine2503-C2)-methyltransferase
MITINKHMINLMDLSWEGMTALVTEMGWAKFRAKQIFRWLYQSRIREIDAMSNLSLADRTQLESVATIPPLPSPQILYSEDGTRKLLFAIEQNRKFESVLIPEANRMTLCVSTQAGCTLDCGFCLTGQMGLQRNLRAQEIVEQVFIAQNIIESGERLSSLVFMGMGEPLANWEAVSDAIHRLTNQEWGMRFSSRKITISTAGMATRLSEVASLGVNLAISLNATTNEQRNLIMPKVNALHPLPELLLACRQYPLPPRRRLTFEYVLLAGINDSDQDSARFPKLLRGIHCKINLIPFNEYPGSPYRRPTEHRITRFQSRLRGFGFDVFVRKEKGDDILGACGQLGTPVT